MQPSGDHREAISSNHYIDINDQDITQEIDNLKVYENI